MYVYIFDLDDTLYPISSIPNSVGIPILTALNDLNRIEKLYSNDKIKQIYDDCWKFPFDELIEKYKLENKYIEAMSNAYAILQLNKKIYPFQDIKILNKIVGYKYIVTTGYEKLQFSKISRLKIKKYFNEIYIDNPNLSNRVSKLHYFKLIINNHKEIPLRNFIVIGDNINSEIKYANILNLTSVWVNRNEIVNKTLIKPDFIIKNLFELEKTLPNKKYT